MVHSLHLWTSVLLVASLARAQPPQAPATAQDAPNGSWQARLGEDLRRSEYAFQPVPGEEGVWSAPNRSHGLRSRISRHGLEVSPRRASPRGEGASWQLLLRTASFGREGALCVLGEPTCVAFENRIELSTAALSEWYVNDEHGIEQGWTIHEFPPGDAASPLWLEIEARGLKARIQGDSLSADFVDDTEQLRLGYRNLHAWDATGRELHAALVPTPSGFAVRIQDDGALYPVTVDPLLDGSDWTADGGQDDADFGFAVAGAGDVNGDGFDDVIVGAPEFDNGQIDEGRAFLYFGSASGLSNTPAWTAEVNQEGAHFGFSVSGAGDVNGDGFDDLLVGAQWFDNGQTNEGGAFLYLGSAIGPSTTPDWAAEGEQTNTELGYSLSGAGDVNGDGFDDVIVGQSTFSNSLVARGRALIYFGSAAGTSTMANWTVEGGQAHANLGNSVSGAGDVDGDGFDDVIVGAAGYDNGQTDEGRAFLYLGSPSGPSFISDWRVESNQVSAFLGSSVSRAGDVNGDGYDDVIVAALRFDNGENDEGRVFLYLGSGSGPSVIADWTAEGDQAGVRFGEDCSGTGDVNGDGFDDVIVGAPLFVDGLALGRAFLYLGSLSGPSIIANWTENGQDGLSSWFGRSVSGAGDVNDDGYDDLIVGAHNFTDLGSTQQGRAFVYLLPVRPADRLYVDKDAVGQNDGSAWEDAFTDLQGALAIAGAGVEIWVAEGTYRPTSGTDRAQSFAMKNGVAVYGGFAGNECELLERDPDLHPTILSGDLFGNDTANFGNYGDNSFHVVVGSGVNASAVLDGFVIRGGNASGSGPLGYGGGIFVAGGSPSITDCTIEKNSAHNGGGIYAGGAPALLLCRIRDNRATYYGGGLSLYGAASLIECTIEINSASQYGGGGLYGGGFRMESCLVRNNSARKGGGLLDNGRSTVLNTNFHQNNATRGGGAACHGLASWFLDCSFTANTASLGGGAFVEGAPVLYGCRFEHNGAGYGGGLYLGGPYYDSPTARVSSCFFVRNGAGLGGAAYLRLNSQLTNCVALQNSANLGGGFYVLGGNASFVNCSIVRNSTWTTVAGGIHVASGQSILRNSIVWQNNGRFGLSQITGSVIASWSQIQGGYPGTGNSGFDPRFVSLSTGDLHLKSTSPCIDRGQSSLVPSWAGFDVEKRHRFFDAPPGNNPTVVDRGAHEFGAPLACAADCDGDGICDATEIGSGSDTDLNGNQIPDLCDGKDSEPSAAQNVPVTLLPAGGTGNPTLEPVIEFTNLTQPGGAAVTVVQSDLDLHPGENTYGTLGNTVTIETTLADGQFFLRVRVPFTFAELGGVHWSSVDLLYFDTGTQHWELAPSANTLPSPGHPGPLGDRLAVSGTSLPTLSDDLGDYGVFYDTATARGFAWANVDHTTDFSAGVLLGTMPDCDGNSLDDRVQIEGGAADCNGNGLLDACELAASIELDCDGNLIPDSCDIAEGRQADCNGNGIPDSCDFLAGMALDCDGNLIPDLCDIVEGRQDDCNGNGIPDSCDIAIGTSLDVEPPGGNGVPDECLIQPRTRRAPPGVPPGPF